MLMAKEVRVHGGEVPNQDGLSKEVRLKFQQELARPRRYWGTDKEEDVSKLEE